MVKKDNEKDVYLLQSLNDTTNRYTKLNYRNSVDVYVRDLSSFPSLSMEENTRLFKQLEAGDVDAVKKIVEGNLRLVMKCASKFVGRGLDYEDLIQEGNLGLMKAIEKYNYKLGYAFSTYATWWIRKLISEAIIDKSRTIRLSGSMFYKISDFEKAVIKLRYELEREPNTQEIADYMGISVRDVEELTQSYLTVISLDMLPKADDKPLMELVANGEVPIDDYVIDKILFEQIYAALDILSDREKAVIVLRFGFEDNERKTLEEVGQILGGITRERVRQIEKTALAKIKNYFETKGYFEEYGCARKKVE